MKKDFFEGIWDKLQKTVNRELEDLSYMEIITATSNKVDGHINEDAWDILQALREGKLPDNARKEGITEADMLNMSNTMILARTRIELDGDIFFLLRGEDGKPLPINQDLIQLHKYGVETSIQNWHFFLNFMIDVTKTIGEIVGAVTPKKST